MFCVWRSICMQWWLVGIYLCMFREDAIFGSDFTARNVWLHLLGIQWTRCPLYPRCICWCELFYLFQMPREFKRKTQRTFPEGDLQQAVEDVLNNRGSLRHVAAIRNVTKSRLALYVKKAREMGIDTLSFKPNFHRRQVFSDQMEKALAGYLLQCSKMFYGVTPKKCRQIALQFADVNNLKFPESWKKRASWWWLVYWVYEEKSYVIH